MVRAFRWQRSRRSTPFSAPFSERTGWFTPSGPSAAPKHVLHYLARYTHRVAISNHRLVDLTDTHVTFLWKDYAHGSKRRTMTAGPPSHSLLRLYGQSTPRCVAAALPNSVGGHATSRCVSRRRTGGLALPSLPGRNAGSRTFDSLAESLRASLSGCSS